MRASNLCVGGRQWRAIRLARREAAADCYIFAAVQQPVALVEMGRVWAPDWTSGGTCCPLGRVGVIAIGWTVSKRSTAAVVPHTLDLDAQLWDRR